MLMGKAIIASAKGESAKIINKANAGLVNNPNNYLGLYENILKFQSFEKEKINEFGRNAHLYYQQNFEKRMLLKKFESWMEAING